MNWKIKYTIGGFLILLSLLVISEFLGTCFPHPTEDAIVVWDHVSDIITRLAICLTGIGCLGTIRETILMSPHNDTQVSLFNALLCVFTGILILIAGIIPILLCLNLLLHPLVPDILKGMITIPFTIYLVFSVGEPMIFGSLFELIGSSKNRGVTNE